MTNEELNQKVIDIVFEGKAPVSIGSTSPSYSSDMNDALIVLNAMHEKGWFWQVDSLRDGYSCTFQNRQRKTFALGAATVPLAICETALLALR